MGKGFAICAATLGALAFPWVSSASPISWTIFPSADTSTTLSNFLDGVACPSATLCWAVGQASNGSINQTLIEKFDGTVWTIVPSPNAGSGHDNFLTGVSCSSTTDCWAVGRHSSGSNPPVTLALHYNGSMWSVVAAIDPNPSQTNTLDAVTCLAANDCWAVGGYIGTDTNGHTLTEHWNGSAWAQVTSGNTSATRQGLFGVFCSGSKNCWAVGNFRSGTGNQTLTEHYTGTTWTVVSSPDSSTSQNNFLTGVWCVTTNDCWAAGYYVNGSNKKQTLTEHYGGTMWTLFLPPNTSANASNILLGITCVTTSDCWAVGAHGQAKPPAPDSNDQTLTEFWDGTAWSIAPSQSTTSFEHNDLYAVACLDANNCWAVGRFVNNVNSTATGVDQTLIEHRLVVTSPTVPEFPWPAPLVMLAIAAGLAIRKRPLRGSARS
jgi:hypothetical protein